MCGPAVNSGTNTPMWVGWNATLHPTTNDNVQKVWYLPVSYIDSCCS